MKLTQIVRFLITCSRCGTGWNTRTQGQCPGCGLKKYTPRA